MAKVEDNRENFSICMQGNCSTCLSYPKGSHEGLYCARGPSERPIENRGCNCIECPVWEKFGLAEMYYCTKNKSS